MKKTIYIFIHNRTDSIQIKSILKNKSFKSKYNKDFFMKKKTYIK